MTRLLTLLGLAAAALTAASPADARLTEAHICKVHRCKTIAASRHVRVFEASAPESVRERNGDEVDYRVAFAVWRPTGRVTELANGTTYHILEPGPYVREAKVAGPYVAYRVAGFVEGRYNPVSVPEEVDRVDARTGRRTLTPQVIVQTECECLFFATTTSGTLAWSFREGQEAESAIDLLPARTTRTRTLARSRTVEPGSLALVPGHLYWLESGLPRTFATP